jgi:hypothetical protein
MRDARESLLEIADGLYVKAVDAHAEGMSLLERSVRIRQLAKIATDEEAERLLAALEVGGLIEPEFPCTSDGGEA